MSGNTTAIALIGLGAAARSIHIPACAGLSEARIVAGCDPVSPATALPFPVYDSLERLLGVHQVDLAIVATPTAHHFPMARELIERGVNVLCEKPFTETLDQAIELVRLADARGVRLAVNNEFRFMACHRAARRMIGDPRFGRLLFVEMSQTFHATEATEQGWRGRDPERTCKEFGTHVFDLCRYFFDAEPIVLRARMPRAAEPNAPDMLNLVDLGFPDGRWARITLDRLTRGRHRYLDIRLDGSEGSVETSLGGCAELTIGINAPTRRPFLRTDFAMGGRAVLYRGERRRWLARDSSAPFADATRMLLDGFLAALRDGGVPPCNGSDNLRTFALMRAAYESAASNRDVDLGFLGELP